MNKNFSGENRLAFSFIGIYCIASIIWGLSSEATWDDDCSARYFATLSAINLPYNFIHVWNRPLFVLIFFIPVQIAGKYSVLFLMTIISASGAYALYKAARELKIPHASIVIPFLLFQAFYFGVSRNALAESLAATVIAFGIMFYAKKQYLAFAIIGSLLPLARLEAAVLLLFWGYILLVRKQFKYIPLLAIPTLIWNFLGTMKDGDLLWLLTQSSAFMETGAQYAKSTIWHYFEKYIFVTGPVVFFFLVIGILESLIKRKADIFVIGQFILGFMLYVVLAWQPWSSGNTAGFLRNIIPVSSLAAFVALYGYNYWIEAVSLKKEQKQDAVKNKNVTHANHKGLNKRQKRMLQQQNIHIAEVEKVKQTKNIDSGNNLPLRMMTYIAVITGLTYVFFSKELVMHHRLSDAQDYTNLIMISGIIAVSLLTLILMKARMPNVAVMIASLLIFSIAAGFTMITEPPNIHTSPEREAMGKVSEIYAKSNLTKYKTYCHHPWFYWVNDINADADENYDYAFKDNLESSPDSSVLIWESHYAVKTDRGLKGNYFYAHKEYLELFRVVSSNNGFVSVVYQKLPQQGEMALQVYDKLIESTDDFPNIYVGRGSVNMNILRNYNAAISDFSKAIELNASYSDAYFNRGLAYFNLRKYNEAANDFLRTTQLNSTNTQAHFNAGVSLSNSGDFKNAVTCYTNAINLENTNAEALYNRAMAYSQLKEIDKACIDFNKAAQLGSENARNAVSLYCLKAG